MFGKIIDGKLTYPPHKITLDGMQIFNPTDEQLLLAGYKQISETSMPDDAPAGQHYEPQYTDGETEIIQSWILVDDSPSDAEGKPLKERVSALEQSVNGISAAIERGLTL